jgi:hypothetical protein
MIIAQKGISRVLDEMRPYAMCLGAEEARRLAERLKEHGDKGNYGWLTIWPHDATAAPANTPPLPWSKDT